MKKYAQRLVAVLLCVCTVFSCMTVTASALDPMAIISVVGSIGTVLGALDQLAGLYHVEPNVIMDSIRNDIYGQTSNFLWCVPSSSVNNSSTRIDVPYTSLSMIAQDWNLNYSGAGFDFPCQLAKLKGSDGITYNVIKLMQMSDQQDRTGRSRQAWFLADGSGRILCSAEAPNAAGTWISIRDLKTPCNMVPVDALYQMAKGEGGVVSKSGDMYFVMNTLRTQALAANDGHAYAAWVNPDQAAIGQERPTTSGTVTEGGDTTNITNENNDYSQYIDIDNMTQVLPGGTLNQIDSLLYDATTKTYYTNSFNTTNNNYDFTVNQYHINYTSITYIGQTAEYDKHYELYYELPDGRDSADLTASDLEQISTSFKDIMNYARSADDLSQRALYHFDGNTQDSSYWSYCSDFHWNEGATLTYMDEGTFGGSLYLDENEHDFTITLPGASDLAGDWTLQFRYYQSHTLTPAWDSTIEAGGSPIFHSTGAAFGNISEDLGPVPIGVWNEFCFVRLEGVIHYYLNGVYLASDTKVCSSNSLRFKFGSEQQTYKKIDELRFTRGAIYTPGQNYEPTSVPYDSNLTLVLPDERVPVADEVMNLNQSTTNYFNSVSLNNWVDNSAISALKTVSLPSDWSTPLYSNMNRRLFYNPSYTSFSSGSGYSRMTISKEVSTYCVDYDEPTYNVYRMMQFGSGLFLSVGGWYSDTAEEMNYSAYGNVLKDTPYTVSVVLADGSYSTATYIYRSDFTCEILSKEISSVIDFEVVDLSSESDTYYLKTYHRLGIRIYPRTASFADIIYMEYESGDKAKFSISYEGAVYDPVQLTESPILAVRSNMDITTYQIGGVRPSYPQKGQVYAMVERGYITSLQQYTGSAWESVDGRIWTGSRWIPASSYNVITLQDMYDIVDSTPDYEYIYSESGFWDWFQRAWKDLISRLDKIIDGQGKGSGGGSVTDDDLPPVLDNTDTPADEGWKAYDLLIVIKDGTWSFVTGVISTGFNGLVGLVDGLSHVTEFFDAYDSDSSANVLGITNYGGSDIWD